MEPGIKFPQCSPSHATSLIPRASLCLSVVVLLQGNKKDEQCAESSDTIKRMITAKYRDIGEDTFKEYLKKKYALVKNKIAGEDWACEV